MALVLIGGASDEHVARALEAFEAAGWRPAPEPLPGTEADTVVVVRDAAGLRAADALGHRYVLVHHGPDDGVPEGTYARAHHRVEASELAELARRLRGRDRLRVVCLAFAYRNGVPREADWVVDVRFLDNPYWVPELRPLDGRHPRVREHVLGQPAARHLLDGLEATLRPLLAEYRRRGRTELTIAFGCTGGRHRSVALAAEMARRLAPEGEVEVELRARELEASPGPI
ncbi:MAG TPA: RNase adapter RapZ [Candidatus Dormibacteraeota bacterium]|nr:RNase adapter RapZ [Candidatus Dormibacteraeota bacterium]